QRARLCPQPGRGKGPRLGGRLRRPAEGIALLLERRELDAGGSRRSWLRFGHRWGLVRRCLGYVPKLWLRSSLLVPRDTPLGRRTVVEGIFRPPYPRPARLLLPRAG